MDIINCFGGESTSLNKGSIVNGKGSLNHYDIKGNLLKTENYKKRSIKNDQTCKFK